MIGAITAGLFDTAVAASTNSFESIATVTLGTSQTTITFNSIPQTYKHLQIRGIARTDRASSLVTNFFIQFNGNTTNPYTHLLRGDGATAISSNFQDNSGSGVGYTSGPNAATGIFSASVIDILDYTNTNKYKTIRSLNGIDANGSGYMSLFSSMDTTNTNAITSIVLTQGGTYNFTANSSFALYGIK